MSIDDDNGAGTQAGPGDQPLWRELPPDLSSGFATMVETRDHRIAELESALRIIADGWIDSGGNRRPHPDSMAIARAALRDLAPSR